MKKRILISFGLLLSIFLVGSVVAWTSISNTTSRMDRLILLHQVEILREELIIHIQQVQTRITRSRVHTGGDVDMLIAQVQEMDRVMDSCVGCHHSPELMQGLLAMRDLAADYKASISQLVTARANPAHITHLEQRAQYVGQELISMTQGMAFTANVRLQQRTAETMKTIRNVRRILASTAGISIVLAVAIVVLLVRGLDQRLQKLVEATRRIARGDLQHRVDASPGGGDEFDALASSFNTMTQNLQRSQRQLLQSAKLAAIGELATNIAYEVNNPLTGVLGYTGLLMKTDDIPESRKEQLKTIERETLRAREILKNLLDFSRRKPPRMIRADLRGIVEDHIVLIKGQAKLANVTIRSDCSGPLPDVAVDVDEIKQVLLNLSNNAFHAMPAGGTLTIACLTERDESGRDRVLVSISDTGQGIPEEHLDKIFDPFFTTRAEGEGTGLGLSISYMIIQNHGGTIEVESRRGAGATFRIALPAARQDQQ